MDYQLGDMVVFTDDHKNTCVGRICNLATWGTEGLLGIKNGGFGIYSRYPNEIRHAEHWETHVQMLGDGILEHATPIESE